ncbi:hypothetical protein HELRODRAFT_167601 [Helobdella robusta]|uniref:Uncharacterized protein n=1 Tax=Helobdella robusta TaxID=6412 RepID=T1EZJ2_HELRO|nr:hypothetical protein HELRODRAFT_167601 [Helobdella robusta]ESO11069.1 hypothetical protein HELRODRAFT_167601 [Helobdella robusta]
MGNVESSMEGRYNCKRKFREDEREDDENQPSTSTSVHQNQNKAKRPKHEKILSESNELIEIYEQKSDIDDAHDMLNTHRNDDNRKNTMYNKLLATQPLGRTTKNSEATSLEATSSDIDENENNDDNNKVQA